MTCNVSKANVGNILKINITPGGGPVGISYTVNRIKQISNKNPVILNTQNSSGEQINYNYTVSTEDDKNDIQLWSDVSYICPKDGTIKTITSIKCKITIGELPPPPVKKFDIHNIGNIGIMIIKGNVYTADETCKLACDKIKKL